MGRKTALLITAGLTVFVIGLGALLAVYLSQNRRTDSATATVGGNTDPTMAEMLAREQAYQAQLEQANRTIQQANEQIAALQASQAQQSPQKAPALTATATPNPVPAAPFYKDDDGGYEGEGYDD